MERFCSNVLFWAICHIGFLKHVEDLEKEDSVSQSPEEAEWDKDLEDLYHNKKVRLDNCVAKEARHLKEWKSVDQAMRGSVYAELQNLEATLTELEVSLITYASLTKPREWRRLVSYVSEGEEGSNARVGRRRNVINWQHVEDSLRRTAVDTRVISRVRDALTKVGMAAIKLPVLPDHRHHRTEFL